MLGSYCFPQPKTAKGLHGSSWCPDELKTKAVVTSRKLSDQLVEVRTKPSIFLDVLAAQVEDWIQHSYLNTH